MTGTTATSTAKEIRSNAERDKTMLIVNLSQLRAENLGSALELIADIEGA